MIKKQGNNKKILLFHLQILSSKPNKICKQYPYLSQISHSYKTIICLQNPVHIQIRVENYFGNRFYNKFIQKKLSRKFVIKLLRKWKGIYIVLRLHYLWIHM